MRITAIQSLEDAQPWIPAWDELVRHAPMRTAAWLLGWWRKFGEPDAAKRLHVWLLHDDDQLVGIAPLYQVHHGGHKHVYRFLGDVGNVCTDHTTWFAKPGQESAVAETVARQLLQQQGWSRLHLEAVDKDDATLAQVIDLLEKAGCLVHRKPTVACWTIPMPDSWDGYLSMLSKNHRKRCRRWLRRYFESGEVQVVEANRQNFDAVWDQFVELHRQRWGDPRHPDGCFTDPKFRAFHREVAEDSLRRDQLRLCYLTHEGQPMAAEYQLLGDESLFTYQSGVSAAHHEIGPGNLSVLATLQFCIDHGISTLDFLRGDEAYKQHWRAQQHDCEHLRIWPQGISGQLGLGYQKARQLAKKWLPG